MNDVLRETKNGIPNLADLARVLMQALDVFVLLFDAKGKARDSICADANNLHPVHRRMIDSGLGEGLPENLYENLQQAFDQALSGKNPESFRCPLPEASGEAWHESDLSDILGNWCFVSSRTSLLRCRSRRVCKTKLHTFRHYSIHLQNWCSESTGMG